MKKATSRFPVSFQSPAWTDSTRRSHLRPAQRRLANRLRELWIDGEERKGVISFYKRMTNRQFLRFAQGKPVPRPNPSRPRAASLASRIRKMFWRAFR